MKSNLVSDMVLLILRLSPSSLIKMRRYFLLTTVQLCYPLQSIHNADRNGNLDEHAYANIIELIKAEMV